jgi:hypothetical protein
LASNKKSTRKNGNVSVRSEVLVRQKKKMSRNALAKKNKKRTAKFDNWSKAAELESIAAMIIL